MVYRGRVLQHRPCTAQYREGRVSGKTGVCTGQSAPEEITPARTLHPFTVPALQAEPGTVIQVYRRRGQQSAVPIHFNGVASTVSGCCGADCQRERKQPSGVANWAIQPEEPTAVFFTSTFPLAFLISFSFASISSTSM